MTDLLRKRTLGRTGIRISPIGIATGSLGADPTVTDPEAVDELAVATLRTALQAGLNYIDTAPVYRGGASDRRVGLALREVTRDRVVLATKVGSQPDRLGDMTGETAVWIIEQSLEVIGTDYIDIDHWCTTRPPWNPSWRRAEPWRPSRNSNRRARWALSA